MKISFVIPCYNAANNIGGVLSEIRQAMETRPDLGYEVVLVNDCSRDDTAAVIKKLAVEDSRVIAVDLARNVGQASALLAGFHYISGELVMTSDDDGQTPVGRVFDFLAEIEKGYDVVCARYTDRDRPKNFRGLGSALNRRMSDWLIEKPEGTYMAAFFMARRYIVDEMIRYRQPYPYLSGLILRATQNVGNVDVRQRARVSGNSGYTMKKLLALWLNGFTAFSIKPLRLSAGCGLILVLTGILTAAITLIRKLAVPAAAAALGIAMAVFLAVSGLILLFMGLIGEYIGRMYLCINETPQYVVKEITGYDGTDG